MNTQFFDLQLLYDDKTDRDFYYGREFIREHKAILSSEVVFRRKNKVPTGAAHWFFGEEKLHGIDLILKEVESSQIKKFLAEHAQKYAHLKPVTKAIVALTASSTITDSIAAYREELATRVDTFEATATFNNYAVASNSTYGVTNHYLKATIDSNIISAITLYEFAKTRGVSHDTLAITFY
jgi:hypothetical protein